MAIAASSRPDSRVTSVVPRWPSTRWMRLAKYFANHRQSAQVRSPLQSPSSRRDSSASSAPPPSRRRWPRGPSQQRRAQWHKGDVDLPSTGRLGLLCLASEQLHGHQEQQQPTGQLQGRHRDVEKTQDVLAEDGEGSKDAQCHQCGLQRGPLALLGGDGRRQRKKDRHRTGRVHDDEQRGEGRGKQREVDDLAHVVTRDNRPCATISSSTSGAVVCSPRRFGLPLPW